jgi:hypothetical protein
VSVRENTRGEHLHERGLDDELVELRCDVHEPACRGRERSVRFEYIWCKP